MSDLAINELCLNCKRDCKQFSFTEVYQCPKRVKQGKQKKSKPKNQEVVNNERLQSN